MEAVVAAIAGVVLSAPAVVAYRHPLGFRILNNAFMVVTWVLFVVLMIWDFASMSMASTLRPYIDRAKFDAASAASDAAMILNWKWFAGWIGAHLYLAILRLLPALGIIAPDAAKKALASDEASRAP